MNDFNRLHELMEFMVNDSITTDQHKELQEILLDNCDAQDVYLDFIDLHFGLYHVTGSKQRIDEFDPMSHQAILKQRTSEKQGVTERASEEDRSSLRQQPISIKQAAIALACLAALVVFLWPTLFRSSPREEIADRNGAASGKPLLESRASVNRTSVKLVQVAGADLFGERLPPVGTAFEFNREYALISGMMKLRFPKGAEVILEAPSIIEIEDPDRLVLRVGNCSVYAPPGAEGFRVDTPRSKIIDRGTRFSVSVNEVGETEVQMIEGLAEIYEISTPAHDSIELSQHQARRFGGTTRDTPEPLPFDSQQYRSELPDRVVRYQARTNEDGEVSKLLNVTVQRGGVAHTYNVADLIGVQITHFHGGRGISHLVVESGYQGEVASVLESDSLLQTGIINPGGAINPLRKDPVFASTDNGDNESTPGIAIRFRRPVINAMGPDIVFFELQTVTHPLDGDAFHVSPLHFKPGLHSTTIAKYDISMNSAEAKRLVPFDQFVTKKPVRSLDGLLHGDAVRRNQGLGFYAIAVGIDLSDLGYADGAAVDGLFFQDVLDDPHTVDPVFIAGLPSGLRHSENEER